MNFTAAYGGGSGVYPRSYGALANLPFFLFLSTLLSVYLPTSLPFLTLSPWSLVG